MVYAFQFHSRSRLQALGIFVALGLTCWVVPRHGNAQEVMGQGALQNAEDLLRDGRYFAAARYAFGATQDDSKLKPAGYALATEGLMRARIPNAASYFFVRTLQTGDAASKRRVLKYAEELLLEVGLDFLKPFLIKYTDLGDYDSKNRNALLILLARNALLKKDEAKAIGLLTQVGGSSPLFAYSRLLRGTAYALQGQNVTAIDDFQTCKTYASRGVKRREAQNLRARCSAGVARTHYQKGEFDLAERVWDDIPKDSIVWTDILFEQAWNAFSKGEYNRTLGKLVSYKSPALQFVFNTEADVLRAQAFTALCLYPDANETINTFHEKYSGVGEQLRKFIESNAGNLNAFYQAGREALRDKVHTANRLHRVLNRFVRSPYFLNLIGAERALNDERAAVELFSQMQRQIEPGVKGGFPEFLGLVLEWRRRTIWLLGGAFVKNSLLDHYQVIVGDFEKISFIKLEVLRKLKEQLMKPSSSGERVRGNAAPNRRDYQYYWGFNGEFWNDELGDYVFGLESECKS